MDNYKGYDLSVNESAIRSKIESISARVTEISSKEILRKIFSLIDLTALNHTDNSSGIKNLVSKINGFSNRYSDLPPVYGLCVFPVFVPLLNTHLEKGVVKKCTVAGMFPSSQTFRDIKIMEISRIMEEGIDEVDVVLPLGQFLEGSLESIRNEIQEMKSTLGNKTLKVILETSSFNSLSDTRLASLLCLDSGADFIKTSTGKNGPGADPVSFYVMCEAIRDYSLQTRNAPGVKAAGGITQSRDAVLYYLIVYEILGNDWLRPERFRIGASKLANNLLGEEYF